MRFYLFSIINDGDVIVLIGFSIKEILIGLTLNQIKNE